MQSTLAPLSISIKKPLSLGITGANATRLTPLIRLTIIVAPTTRAPEFPAERNASPSPAASFFSPSAMEELFLLFIISPAESSIVITSGAVERNLILLRHTADLLFISGKHDINIKLTRRFRAALDDFEGGVIPAKRVYNDFHKYIPCFSKFLGSAACNGCAVPFFTVRRAGIQLVPAVFVPSAG